MSIFKCKMCGGTLEISENQTVAECEYCGTQQTLPRLNDERKANLYDRANHFRRNNEFDKAMSIYENILSEDGTDAEAYWSLVLCRYGIEYVEDPATHKRVPTVNRAQFTSIFDDDNYKSALENADISQRAIYEAEAKAINEIQKGILAISQKEEPFDVFICYKETDNNGRRTPDSVLANDLYHQLVQEGFKVFFSRITLEDKLGTAYEPYIFAALNSAKVMVVLGTRPEYFKAVWVKNEWSRYLSLVKQSGGKKVLIPAYKDMDPYDLPEEFSHLQAQDMGKLGFMQDLIRGIKKLTQVEAPKVTVKETVIASGNANVAPLLKRAFMYLEDGDWKSADEYCERVLDQDPENAEAYLGKLMAELHVRKQDNLQDQAEPFDGNGNYTRAMRFGSEQLKRDFENSISTIQERKELARVERERKAAIAKKKTRRICAVMIVILVIVAAGAALYCQTPAYKLIFSDNGDGTVNVAGLRDSVVNLTQEITIPSHFFGKSVTGIDPMAFCGYKNLTSVTIPDNVISIGYSAFSGCTELTEITIPDSVTSVGTGVFFGCTGLTSVTIPDSVTSIGNNAFSGCTGLTSITIPNSVTSIVSSAFWGCTGLTSITIPNSVTSIGNSAFSGCTGLTSITIPNSVTSIGNNVFSDCISLTSASVPYIFVSRSNALFADCPKLSNVTVTIPDSITSIDTEMFSGCFWITSITIPDSVTSIGNNAFYGCTGLTSVTIPDNVTSIDGYAFWGCTGLTSVTIPDSVSSIGSFAFYGCTGLAEIHYNGTKVQWDAITKGSTWNYSTGNYTIYCTDGEIKKGA